MPPTESHPRPSALITGASSGLGTEFARLCAADRYDLVLVARRKDRLESLKGELESKHGVTSHVIACDLSDPASPRSIYDQTSEAGLTVDVLINNAGFGLYGTFTETDLDVEMRMIQVNVAALTELTKYYVRDMVSRGSGMVLNVASTAAFQPGPYQPVYYASKAFVLSFSDGVADNLRGTGVRVSTFCPGPMNTEFGDIAGTRNCDHPARRSAVLNTPEAAKIAWEGMKAGKRLVVPGISNKMGMLAVRLLPRWVISWLTRRIQFIPPDDGADA